ncbi:MAG: rhodanese-like domain-containing protein [Deltaproteobacteria bacterium]|nr:MAG: rhodanese-like domain-containing protein [Deltaproteobacteria bacterium]
MHDYSDLKRILLEVLLIVALGVVIGLSSNARLLYRVWTGQGAGPATPATTTTETAIPEPVMLDQARELIRTKQAVIIDARIRELYLDGHLPGAISLPLEEADTGIGELAAGTGPDRPLLVYCNGYGCPDSFDLAKRLLESGWKRVMVFEGGFPEWHDAGLPVVRGDKP